TDAVSRAIIENATFIKCKCVEVINTFFAIEPVPFNKGFYSIDITYIFNCVLEAFTSTTTPPQTVSGSAQFCKKVILFGSDGNAKVFNSEEIVPSTTNGCFYQNLPKATVQVVEPICLDCKLVTKYPHPCPVDCCSCNPQLEQNECPEFRKKVYVTIGIFSIIHLSRQVSLLIPAYDYCIPNKDCSTSSDSPCELFEKIKFPVNEFFPPSLEDVAEDCVEN
ncbi:MAG: hypothetical protein WC900_07095, partial [Oscillospiraceae bacterium]